MRTIYFLCSILISSSTILATEPNQGLIRSVDLDKVRKEKHLEFIEHVFWPKDNVIASKKIANASIPEDIEKFKDAIKQVLRNKYLPPEELIDSNVIALEGYKRNADYILLKYRVDNCEIRITECKALYIAILPEPDPNVPAAQDLPEYIRKIAFEVLNLPEHDDNGKEPEVYVSPLDIGQSKFGAIHFDKSFAPKFWYSHLRWWSDGKNVLFQTVRSPLDKEDLSKRAGPPPNLGAPRKFKKVKN